MTIQDAVSLVKFERELIDRYGFRSVLLALARVAKEGAGAEWSFLGLRLHEVADRDVPSEE